MNAEMNAERVGYLIGSMLVLLLPLWFFFKAFRAEKRSLGLANFALACGLCVLFRPERALPQGASPHDTGLLMARSALLLVGAVGFVLAVMAMRARTSDGGTGVARPVIALLLCLMLGVNSGGMVMMSWGMNPDNQRPWEWTSAQHGYRLRLPSSACVEGRMKDADASFVCGVQGMRAGVFARPANEAAYTAASLELINKLRNPFLKAPVVEETRTEAGWPCTRATLVERAQNGSKPIMTSIALIHWPERQLLFTVMVEGEVWSASEAVSLVLRDTFQKSAQGIHLSLGPAAVSPKPGTSASQAEGVH
jgi:hypothetical protein